MIVKPMGRFLNLAVLGLVTGLVLSVSADLRAQEQHRLGGGDVAVYNLAGAVEVVAGSGSEVVVQVTRGGVDAGRLDIGVQQVSGRQALVVRYPDDQVVYPEMGRGSNTQMTINEDGTFSDRGGLRNRRVRVSGSGDGMEAWADLRISVPRGQELSLYLAVGRTELTGVTGSFNIDTGSGAVFARNAEGEISIDTGSGEVEVEGFSGNLLVDTGSGSVDLTDVRGGEVMVDTGSGSVSGTAVSASSLSVDTGSGEIRLTSVSSPDVVLDTGSGRVEVELIADVDRFEADTGSGAVVVRVPSTLGAEVELDTGSGGINMDLPLEVRQVRRNYLLGILGDGRGTFRVDTGSGGIRLIAR